MIRSGILSEFASFVALAIAGQAATADVIAHWTFDADFTDSSTSGNDLSVAGSDPAITTAAGDWKFGGGAVTLIPEPNALLIWALSLIALAWRAWRRG